MGNNIFTHSIKRLSILLLSGVIVISLFLVYKPASGGKLTADSIRALPEFTETTAEKWINASPMTVADFRGKVLLLDFWTFDCWNCYRSFPWLNALEKRYRDAEFQVIGIHTPEFDHERVRTNIEAKVKEYQLYHPIMIDNDFSYWKAMNNQYWPAYYLVDKAGKIQYQFIGETHAGDSNAKAIEAAIKELLDEK
jgi:thiol-disulfide isomerase/thioredoxin